MNNLTRLIAIRPRMPRIVLRCRQRAAERCKFIANYFHFRHKKNNHAEAVQLARNTINIQSTRLHRP